MLSDSEKTATTRKNAEASVFQKRIGSTIYRVTVHFSKTSADTFEDKLIRLMQSKVRESA